MRIGFLLPGSYALSGMGNGVAAQARFQADALERRGHTVVRLNPWESQNGRRLDVLHFFHGGMPLHDIALNLEPIRDGLLVFAPMIDSNQPFFTYRLAAAAGSLTPRVLTVPGVLRQQALRSDVVVARSDHERERLIRSLGIAPDRIALVLNGAPQPPAADAIDVAGVRRALGLPEEFVLHISSYTQERKNVLRLVQAIEPLDLPLVLAGTALPGNILDRLEQRVRAGARVRLLGFVDEATKAALYAACKVFCLPSIHEGTGLVAVEAAAHGARIVITRNGGPPDYFGAHAEYVDPFNVGDIRRAVERAWRRPDDGGALRRHVIQHLTWDASAAELERVYVDRLQRLRGARLENPVPVAP